MGSELMQRYLAMYKLKLVTLTFMSIMNIKQLSLATTVFALTFTTVTNAVLGPIPIYLNTEYRTTNPVIGSIASSIILTQEDIINSGATSLVQLLAQKSSLNIKNAHGQTATLFIRGTSTSHTLLLIDGIKSHDLSQANGNPELSNIPLSQIERIEIIKGPYSSLYGSNAIGGVINIITKKNIKNDEHGSVSILVGTQGTTGYKLNNYHNSDNTKIIAGLSKYHTDGISAKVGNTEKDHVDQASGNLKLIHQINSQNKIIIDLLKSNYESGYDNKNGPADGADTNWIGNLRKKDLTKIHTILKTQVSDIWSTTLSASQLKINNDWIKPYSTDVIEKFKSTELTFVNDIKIYSDLLVVGLSHLKEEKTSPTTKKNIENAIFGEWQGQRGTYDLLIGARLINHSSYGNHHTYNLGMSKLVSDVKITISHGNAFRSPSIFELGYNADLKLETSKSYELGFSKSVNNIDIDIDVYRNRITNMIKWGGENYGNLKKITTKGVDILTSYIVLGWNSIAEYNYNSAKEDGETEQMDNRPQHSLGLSLNKQFGKINQNINIVRKSKQIGADHSEPIHSSYTLLNLASNYKYNNQWSANLTINNALDKKYTLAKDNNQLGRNIHLEITKKF